MSALGGAAARGAPPPPLAAARARPGDRTWHRGADLAATHLRNRRCSPSAAAAQPPPPPGGGGAPALDTGSVVVRPSFRSAPAAADAAARAAGRAAALLLVVSEAGVCRAPLAAACLGAELAARGLADKVIVDACAAREYCVGEGPELAAAAAAQGMGLALPPGYAARQFDPAADAVAADLILVFDKYGAADVLREVSVLDTVQPGARHSARVRRLGEFHAALAAAAARGAAEAADIGDPLYGNVGGDAEAAAVAAAAELVAEAAAGVAALLARLDAGAGGAPGALRAALAAHVRGLDATEWLVPPMLRPRE